MRRGLGAGRAGLRPARTAGPARRWLASGGWRLRQLGGELLGGGLVRASLFTVGFGLLVKNVSLFFAS